MTTLTLFPATDRRYEGDTRDLMMSKYPYDGFHPYHRQWAKEGCGFRDLDPSEYMMTEEEYENFIAERVMAEGRDPYVPPGPIRRFQIDRKKQRSMRSLLSKISAIYDSDDRYRLVSDLRKIRNARNLRDPSESGEAWMAERRAFWASLEEGSEGR